MDLWIPTALAGAAAWATSSTLLPIRGLHEWFGRESIWRCPSHAVALTFDDGPDPEKTQPLLDLLAAAHLRATFFVIGAKAMRWPALVGRIAAAGHTVGNHSFSHRSFPLLSSREITSELVRCNEVVETITGVTPRFVRVPYGRRDVRFYRIAARLGLTPVFWSLDTLDWLGSSSRRVAARASRARGGDIVLMHDGNPRAVSTPTALRLVLGRVRNTKVDVASMADLFPRMER
jgi:peptidoglycan/xylan/chitin deacetylase (PgdA/CDA1 family)